MTDKLSALIELDEGRVPYVYKDSLGYATIGVGFLVDKAAGGRIPDEVIDFWLAYEIKERGKQLLRALPWAAHLDDVRLAVLIDLAYNVGVEGVQRFVKTLTLMKTGAFVEAADEILRSKWARQVGKRADRLSMMLRTGRWPSEVL